MESEKNNWESIYQGLSAAIPQQWLGETDVQKYWNPQDAGSLIIQNSKHSPQMNFH